MRPAAGNAYSRHKHKLECKHCCERMHCGLYLLCAVDVVMEDWRIMVLGNPYVDFDANSSTAGVSRIECHHRNYLIV